jgi:tetratricopeptide (TPR) repeat protein
VGREFEQAVRADPSNLRAQRDLIEFYGRAPGLVGGGEAKAWEQAEALAGRDSVEGSLARGELWRIQGRPDRAESEYRQVLAARPNRAGPYLEVADFYQERKDGAHMAEAVQAAGKLLREYADAVPPRSDFPSPAAAREWLGRVYERQGRAAEAAQEYRAALGLDPDRRGAREALRRLGRK